MKNYVPLQELTEQLSQDVLWFDSIIQEIYFVSGDFFVENEGGGHGITGLIKGQRARIRIALCCHQESKLDSRGVVGMDLILESISSFQLERNQVTELGFNVSMVNDCIEIDFSNPEMHGFSNRFSAKKIYARLLTGKEYLGPAHLLGHEFPEDDLITSTILERCWRQCSQCGDAWEENPKIDISRCPTCGEVTQLNKQ